VKIANSSTKTLGTGKQTVPKSETGSFPAAALVLYFLLPDQKSTQIAVLN
jgi:hypothetical protein